MHPPGSTLVPLLIFVPVIIWRFYSRVRKSIGRQTLSKVRPWITVTVFPLLIVLFSVMTRAHPERLWLLAGAVIVGSLLGIFGLGKTAFEYTPQGMFYTPNAHLGIALSVLLGARIIYRMFQIYSTDPGAQLATPDFARSPLTLAVFGVLAGYYVAYAIGLIRYGRRPG
jgi:hypothetical protein